MMNKFKPMLYVNNTATVHEGKIKLMKWTVDKNTGDKEIEYLDIPNGEYFLSTKYDGVRCIITPYGIESRSKSRLPNDNLYKYFAHIIEYCKKEGVVLDGELYGSNIPFSEIISICMTKGDKKLIPNSLIFYCFDCVKVSEENKPFVDRLKDIPGLNRLLFVGQQLVSLPDDADKIMNRFHEELKLGNEGLIIRGVNSFYKHGRTTPKCGTGYKFKQYDTYDAKIIGVIQSTIAKKDSEKKTNELGRSVTSKKKNDRQKIEMASAFLCDFEGKVLKVTLGVDKDKALEIWRDKEKYLGHKCEFKAMETTKDLPRHPQFLRMRWNEEEE